MEQPVRHEPASADGEVPAEDVRAGRPYLLAPASLRSFARRAVSTLVLATIDVAGLVIGLYLALALRAFVVDPHPVLWGLLWNEETNWLAFLILLLVLVFWRARLYGPREVREGAARVVPGVFLVAALALAFAIGTGQHFETFGLYVTGAVFVSVLIALFRASYEALTEVLLRSLGVRRRVVLVGDADTRAHLRDTLGSSRGGIKYEFVDEVETGPAVDLALARGQVDELIVSDPTISDDELLEFVDLAQRRGAKVRVAPRTTELLVERGEYVPGQGVPLFELRPPIFAGTQWATKRVFDVAVVGMTAIVGMPVWLLVAAGDQAHVAWARPLRRSADRPRRARVPDAQVPDDGLRGRRPTGGARARNEATGALFKIRDDPRVTTVGRLLRRLSIDELPNLLNVLRGEMSLVGPRPLPLRDYALLDDWHRRRYNVLPGVTGLWQIAGRSDLTFDDLVRLDFYYLENWSIWLDITILVKTPFAVFQRRGAY